MAVPAMSGTNAYAIAMKLASKMRTKGGKLPTVKVIKPSYYEFDDITRTTSSSEADIFTLTAGPVVNPDGLTPGIDINRFVRRNIINTGRIKPATLVVDTTTALYKNLKLDPEVQELVRQGLLSIIINESHQKFGLIHTDQVQYGRMFGFCSKDSFSEEIIQEVHRNAEKDFNSHMDMRIGAYISTKCSDTLERIKQQHFTNGALLRNILTQSELAEQGIVSHEDMLRNLDELYFVTSLNDQLKYAVSGIAYVRDSFGHYSTTRSRVNKLNRISADARDSIGCLLQTAQIYLAHHYQPKQLISFLLVNSKQGELLTLEEQITSIAMINNVISSPSINDLLSSLPLKLQFYCSMENILSSCTGLKGREYYRKLEKYNTNLRKSLVEQIAPENQKLFFEACKIICSEIYLLDMSSINILKSNIPLLMVITKLSSSEVMLDELLINSLIAHHGKIDKLSDHIEQLEACFPLIKSLQDKGVVITANILIELVTNIDEKLSHDLSVIIARAPEGTRNVLNKVMSIIKNDASIENLNKYSNVLNENTFNVLGALSEMTAYSDKFTFALEHDELRLAAMKIYSTDEDIIYKLKKSPGKHRKALNNAPVFLNSCFDSMYEFYSNPLRNQNDKDKFAKSLDGATEIYCNQALNDDSSAFSKMGRLALKAITNIIALGTLGVAHYIHYKNTGRMTFFGGTASENEMKDEIWKFKNNIMNTP